jgi:hypothetical protein
MGLLVADHDREAQYRWHIQQPEMVVRVESGRGEQFGCSERLDD